MMTPEGFLKLPMSSSKSETSGVKKKIERKIESVLLFGLHFPMELYTKKTCTKSGDTYPWPRYSSYRGFPSGEKPDGQTVDWLVGCLDEAAS